MVFTHTSEARNIDFNERTHAPEARRHWFGPKRTRPRRDDHGAQAAGNGIVSPRSYPS